MGKKKKKEKKLAKAAKEQGQAATTGSAHKAPKKIAGVKLPKPLREQGAQLVELLGSPAVADMMATALIAAANALQHNAREEQKPANDEGGDAAPASPMAAVAASVGALIAAKAGESVVKLALGGGGAKGEGKGSGPKRLN